MSFDFTTRPRIRITSGSTTTMQRTNLNNMQQLERACIQETHIEEGVGGIHSTMAKNIRIIDAENRGSQELPQYTRLPDIVVRSRAQVLLEGATNTLLNALDPDNDESYLNILQVAFPQITDHDELFEILAEHTQTELFRKAERDAISSIIEQNLSQNEMEVLDSEEFSILSMLRIGNKIGDQLNIAMNKLITDLVVTPHRAKYLPVPPTAG